MFHPSSEGVESESTMDELPLAGGWTTQFGSLLVEDGSISALLHLIISPGRT